MGALLLTISLLLALLVVLLAVPIELAFSVDRNQQTHGHINVRWLFGLVRFRIGIPGTTKTGKTKKEKAKHKPITAQTRTSKARSRSPKFFIVLKQSAFRRRLLLFIKDLIRATHPHELFLRCRIGLGDPADTGQLWALLGPLAALATNIRGAVVRIEPEFIDPAFKIQSHGKFRFIPLEFIALIIAFALSPPSLRAWRTLRQSKVL